MALVDVWRKFNADSLAEEVTTTITCRGGLASVHEDLEGDRYSAKFNNGLHWRRVVKTDTGASSTKFTGNLTEGDPSESPESTNYWTEEERT